MKYLKSIIIIFFFPIVIFSQGGSVYTRFGLGDVFYSSSVRRTAMGDLGFAMLDRDNLGTTNPASWSGIVLTKLQASVAYRGVGISGPENNAFYSNAQFSGFLMGVPIDRGLGIAMVAGLVPVTQVRYEVIDNPVISDVTYHRNYRGTGGISKAFFGSSYTLPFGFTVGASLDYYNGNIDNYSSINFDDPNYIATNYRRAYEMSGLGFSLGLISSDFSKYLKINSISDLRFGLTYSTTGNFHADSTLYANTLAGNESLVSSEVNASYPDLFGAGLSMRYKRNYTIIFDYLYQAWGNYKFNGHNYSYLRNINKISAGIEHKNAEPSLNSFWEHVALWGGLSYEQTQYFINNQGINEYSIHGGISIPIDPGNSLDIGVKYGIRGTQKDNLLKEQIFNVNFGLSLGEPWFVR